MDDCLPPFQVVFGGDKADGGMEAGGVVVFDEVADDALGFREIERGEWADGLVFDGLVEAFEFAVGLGVVGAGHDMAGLPLGDEGFELTAFELGALVGDDAWARVGIGFAGFLENDFGVDLAHGGTDVPGDDHARAAVEHGAEEVEDATDVQVTEVHMPVLVRGEGLDEAGAFFGGFASAASDEVCCLEHAVGGGGCDRCHVGIEHHEGEGAITFEWVLAGVVDDGLFFPFFQPVLTRHLGVVFVGFAVAFAPTAELARA